VRAEPAGAWLEIAWTLIGRVIAVRISHLTMLPSII
jgi:hypothetical protein